MITIQSIIEEQGYILADGAMGTMLFAAGLEHGGSPELWNIEAPEAVSKIHQEYLDAGAQILLTNTFGGNRYRLALHGLENKVNELNRAGAKLLRQVVNNHSRQALVAGDLGPSGSVMTPYGDLSFEDAKVGFAEQASALIEGGVDLIWIETMADLQESRAAYEGVRQVSANVPIISTMTFDTRGRTMMGVTPEQAVAELLELGSTVVGGNCGNGPEEIIGVVAKMHLSAPDAILAAKANAGIPELIGGKVVYRATPEMMGEYAVSVYNAGARVIGTCCGSTPAHIKMIADTLAAHTPVSRGMPV